MLMHGPLSNISGWGIKNSGKHIRDFSDSLQRMQYQFSNIRGTLNKINGYLIPPSTNVMSITV